MDSALPITRRGLAVHTLDVIKKACQEALDIDEPDMALFRAVIDPGLVWELATLVEQLQHENAMLTGQLGADDSRPQPGGQRCADDSGMGQDLYQPVAAAAAALPVRNMPDSPSFVTTA